MQLLTGETTSILLFFMGIIGIISSRRMLKTIISISVMQTAAVLFYLTMFANPSDTPPIATIDKNVADPLPHALMITAIVIGVAVTAISLVMFINLYHRYGTSHWDKANKIRMGRM